CFMILYLFLCEQHRASISFPTRCSSDLGAFASSHTQRKRNLGVAFKAAGWYDMQHICCISKYGSQPGCGGINRWQSTPKRPTTRSEEHTSELQSRFDLVFRLLLEKKK